MALWQEARDTFVLQLRKAGEDESKVRQFLLDKTTPEDTKKFCGTRAEWADRKRQDRETLEGAQRSPCMITTTGATGRPAC